MTAANPELPPPMRAIEDRAFAARLNLGDLCQMAKVSHSTWSRAKARGSIRPRTLKRLEETLDWYEGREGSTDPRDRTDG